MILKFIEETFERDPKEFLSHKQIHKIYIAFAKKNNLEIITQKKLTQTLNTLRVGQSDLKFINGKSTNVRYGLRLK